MKEAEYLALDADPARMLTHLRTHRRDLVSDRKQRLFACGVMRQVWGLLPSSARRAVSQAEQCADGLVSLDAMGHAGRHAYDDIPRHPTDPVMSYDVQAAVHDARQCTLDGAFYAATEIFRPPCVLPRPAMADLIRGVFGNPFYQLSTLADVSRWCLWNAGAILRMAEAIYAARSWDELPIFADAIEDAGCDDVELLAHCRGFRRCPSPTALGCGCRAPSPDGGIACQVCDGSGWLPAGPHVRGDWVLDLLTGRR